MYYYRARYYAPNLGRFISIDPILFDQSLNQYTFVENNPGTYNDPTGHMAYKPDFKFCASTDIVHISNHDEFAESWVSGARKYTHQKNKVYKKCGKAEFKMWFGCRGSNYKNRRHWAHVERIIRRMDHEFKKGKRYYRCVTDPDVRASAFPIRKQIYIGPRYWVDSSTYSPEQKNRRRARTIVHETAHKKGAVLFNKNVEYGKNACLKKAENDPYRAKENADNYALFSEWLKYKSILEPSYH